MKKLEPLLEARIRTQRGVKLTAADEARAFHPAVLRLYAARLGSRSAALRFLRAPLESIPRPYVLPGMGSVVYRIETALTHGERIAVFGHDDPDGITSAVALTETLESLGAEVLSYIPDRAREGHGLYADLVHHFHREGVTLLVTTDGCSSNVDEAKLAATLGMDVAVTDHHEIPRGRPVPLLIVNPKADAETAAAYGDLTGVGVAALLCRELLARASRNVEDFTRLLDLVALGTIADYAHLGRNNRALVVCGLGLVAQGGRRAVQSVKQDLGLKPSDLLDPERTRFLAAVFASVPSQEGRSPGFDALIGRAHWESNVDELMDAFDRNRRGDRQARELIEREARRLGILQGAPAVLFVSEISPQRLGRAATHLCELTSRPAVVVLEHEGMLTAELRAPEGVHLVEILAEMQEIFESWGGHQSAAGFSAAGNRLQEIERRLSAAFSKFRPPEESSQVNWEETIHVRDVDRDFVRSIRAAAPFGRGNAVPLFRVRGFGGESGQLFQPGEDLEIIGDPGEQPKGRDAIVSFLPREGDRLFARLRGWVPR